MTLVLKWNMSVARGMTACRVCFLSVSMKRMFWRVCLNKGYFYSWVLWYLLDIWLQNENRGRDSGLRYSGVYTENCGRMSGRLSKMGWNVQVGVCYLLHSYACLNLIAFVMSHLPSCYVMSTLPLTESERNYWERLPHLLQRGKLALCALGWPVVCDHGSCSLKSELANTDECHSVFSSAPARRVLQLFHSMESVLAFACRRHPARLQKLAIVRVQ